MSYQRVEKPNKPPVRWDRIKLLAFDCDGVLTDGKIIYDSTGNELKHFDAHDGMAFMLLRQAGIITAIITGRNSPVVERRARDLKIDHVFQGIANKQARLGELLAELNLEWQNVLYMGDDWNDVPCMFKAAVSVCPSDAPDSVTKLVEHVTERAGGHGAVRECIRMVLEKQGIYDQTLLAYINSIS